MYLSGTKGKTAPNWVNTIKLKIFTYVSRMSNPDLLSTIKVSPEGTFMADQFLRNSNF